MIRRLVRPLAPWTLLGLALLFPLLGERASGQGGQTANPLADSTWPKYRRDLAQTGRSPLNGPAKAALLWTFSTGRKEAEGGIETDPTVGPDGTVYIGANNGILYALDGETGEVRWAFPTLFDRFAIYSSAAIDRAGRVYFGAKDGFLYVLAAPEKGILARVVWRHRIGTTIETSPTIAPDGTVFIGGDDAKLYAIAPPRDGQPSRTLWTFQTGDTLISSPALAPDGTIYIGSMDGKLYALEPTPAGAKVRWAFFTGKTGEFGGIENAPALGPDGTVYVGANDGVLYALDGKTGGAKWSYQTGFRNWGIFSSAAIGSDGTIYVGPKDGVFLALGPPGILSKTGRVKWGYKVGTTIETSPALAADGTVYLGADNGKIYALRPPQSGTEGQLLWSFQTQGTLISSPVIGPRGRLYEGSMDGKLYAFGEGAGRKAAAGALAGTWYGQSGDGRGSGLVFVIVQRGEAVEGVWRLANGIRGDLAGEVKGDQANVTFQTIEGKCSVAFTGSLRVSGDRLSGSYAGKDCVGRPLTGKLEATR